MTFVARSLKNIVIPVKGIYRIYDLLLRLPKGILVSFEGPKKYCFIRAGPPKIYI